MVREGILGKVEFSLSPEIQIGNHPLGRPKDDFIRVNIPPCVSSGRGVGFVVG